VKPSRTGMFTAATLPCNALTIAISERDAGHLVSACSVCITADTRAVLQGVGNVSHGLCDPCLDFALAQVGQHASPEGRAA
jgi:hypothetical protein